MGKQFDERYPAIFQPGGDRLLHTAEVQDEIPVATGPWAHSATAQDPAQAVVEMTTVVIPPSSVLGKPAEDQRPETASEDELLQESAVSARETYWGAKTWIIGIGAALLTLVGAAFCFLAAYLIPSARAFAPDKFHGIMVIPWGKAIIPGAPALLTAGLGMIAAMLFMGSLHYGSEARKVNSKSVKARCLWAGTAVVALISLAGSAIALFSWTFLKQIMFSPENSSDGANFIPWTDLVLGGVAPLMVLGLVIVALVILVRPSQKPSGCAVSGKAALVVGGVYGVCALLAWFAPQLFPLSMGSELRSVGGQEFSTEPWPQTLTSAGGSLAMVGFGVGLWGVLILASSRRVLTQSVSSEASPQIS